MNSPIPRRACIVATAAAFLAISALLPGASHAAAPLHRHIRLPFVPAHRTTALAAVPVPVLPASSTNVDASKAAGAQSETFIAGTKAFSTSLVAGSNDIALTSGAMRAYASVDGGKTWSGSQLLPSAAAQACARSHGGTAFTSDPGIGARDNGVYFYSYLSICTDALGSPVSDEVDIADSFKLGLTWTPAIPVFSTITNPNPAVFQDKPMLTVDNNPGSPTNGRVYVAWDQTDATNTQHIELAWSDNYGAAWHVPVQVDVRGSGGVIYADPAVAPDGRVSVIWNDYGVDSRGRFSLIQFAAASNTPAAGYVPSFTTNTTVAGSGINLFNDQNAASCSANAFPGSFCLPAQPDRGIAADPSLLADSSGRLYALWTQGVPGSAVTDVESQTSTDGGAHWSTPVQVNDDNTPGVFTAGASDFFPWGAIDPNTGALHVSFYSTRLDPTNRTTNVYDAISTTHGSTFSANNRVTDVASNESVTNPLRDLNNYGDYEGITIQGGTEHPVWTDTRFFSFAAEEVFTTSR